MAYLVKKGVSNIGANGINSQFFGFRQIMIILPFLPPFMQKYALYYIFTDDNQLRNLIVFFCIYIVLTPKMVKCFPFERLKA